jgi:putative PIN family toxin of toxin-antitoxin system
MRVVVVDTNIWVSAFLTPRGYAARLKALWQAGRFDVIVSTPLLIELAEVLSRPRLQNKYACTSVDYPAYVRLIAELSDVVSVTGTLSLARDPDDDLVLETAIVGRATHLVSRDEDMTRDTDLYQQLEQQGLKAVTLTQFLGTLEMV